MKPFIKCIASAFSALAISAFGLAQNKAESTTPEPAQATIRLVVNGAGNPYLDRNQYQLLLDNKHQLADNYKEDLDYAGYYLDPSIVSRLYGEVSATIPAGLSATNVAIGVNPDAEASITVDPGVYDIFLLQSYDWGGNTGNVIRKVLDQGTHDPFYVDDITLAAGKTYTFNVTFLSDGAHAELIRPIDLQLNAVMGENKPSCEMQDMAVSLSVTNIGSTDVNQYEIFYTVNGSTDTVRESINAQLGIGKDTVVTFQQKLALTNGIDKLIKAGILVKDEAETSNNYGQYTATYFEAEALPMQVDTRKMHASKAEDWTLDDNDALVASQNAATPVFSTCFHAENAGLYRLNYEYICGRSVITPDGEVIVRNVDVYKIRVGKTTQKWEDWAVIVTDSTITGSANYDEFTPKEVVFNIQEPGDYAFCIYADRANENDNLKFRHMAVSEINDFAARLKINMAAPRIIPVDWANGTWNIPVAVENRGLKKLDNASLVILANGREVKRQSFSLDSAKTQDITVNAPMAGFKKDDDIKLEAKVLMGTENVGSIEFPLTLTVSQDVAAFDHISDYTKVKTMSGYSGGKVGLIFPVMKKDTLTALSIGWGGMEENIDVNISVQKVSFSGQEISLDNLLYETKTRRGILAGQTTYNIPDFLLEPGLYFISVEQVGETAFHLAMDESEEGFFVLFDKNKNTWDSSSQAGYPAIRAIFGSDGKLYTKDAAVEAIVKPLAGGIMSDNESIVVKVRNNGTEEAEIPVHVRIDDTELTPRSVRLAPYESAEVVFSANLAANTENRNILITAFTALSQDENNGNDTLKKQVLSLAPADPYIMDFESCLDFVSEGLNPAWTSVSLDQTAVLPLRHVLDGEFHYVEFPGSETDLGFITFNPVNTEPSMLLYDFYLGCRPHSGQRFGVSLGLNSGDTPKDDWLISPKLKMPAKNSQISMWVKSFDKAFKESYEILVSRAGNDPASGDFTRIYPGDGEELIAESSEWQNKVFDLSRFNNQEIHVAIRCISLDAPMFMIDDIVIGDGTNIPSAIENTPEADFRLTVYPNPVKDMVTLLSPDAVIKEVCVFNATGTLLHRSANNLCTNNYRYNTAGMDSGLYFMRISTESGVAVQKFIVR